MHSSAASRRVFISRIASSVVWTNAVFELWGQTEANARILQFDWTLLDEWRTANSLFFLRDHSGEPSMDAVTGNVFISGMVARPFKISYEELAGRPARRLAVTLECAENAPGGGMVGNAEWTGVTLASLLAEAEPQPKARAVRLCGADGFQRVIPLTKAMHTDTLVAWGMNGEKLPSRHGAPARAIISGWYGMNSVKWLNRIEVLSEAKIETYLREIKSGEKEPITAINVNSSFARPTHGAIISSRRIVLRGAAWAGENKIRTTEVSSDGGKTWRHARLLDAPQQYAWVRWESEWKIEGPGNYDLVVCATDDAGRRQPETRDPRRSDGYEMNSYQRIQVMVR
jgi:DMSO/TMAO reductase YedYZ molybdopterin-dependent catalytic subunit